MARALAADPDLLLMDEPFAAVDPITRAALQDELLRIQRRTGKTIVFVTHDIDEALQLASVIGVLDRGRLAQWGTPLDIIERPASDFVAEFVGGDGERPEAAGAAHGRRAGAPRRDGRGRADRAATPRSRDALAAMIARRADRLPVVDASGRPLGAIALSDLVR